MTVAPPFRPAAVVFDLDGLLVDSEEAWGRAEQRVVAELGYAWDPAVRTLLLGKGPQDASQLLADHLGIDDAADLAARMHAGAEAEFARGIPPRPGAAELVAALGKSVGLAVATNSSRRLATMALSSSGLAGAFAAVVCVEDVAAPKPAPDLYLAACERLGADPRSCVGLEDSPVGALAAASAGLWVIGCPSLAGAVLPAADVVVATLADVDPRGWFDRPAVAASGHS